MHEDLTAVNSIEQQSPELPKKKPAAQIIREVAAAYGISVDDLKGPGRDRRFVRARCEAMRLVADEWRWLSYPVLGRMFNRDHSTVMHHLRKGGDHHTKKQCTCDQGPTRAKKGGTK